jgi:hypothetical protein
MSKRIYRRKSGRTRGKNQRGKNSSPESLAHYLERLQNFLDGLVQDSARAKQVRVQIEEARALLRKAVAGSEEKEARVSGVDFEKWITKLERAAEKVKGFGFLRAVIVGRRPGRANPEAVSEKRSISRMRALDRVCCYHYKRPDRPNPRKVYPGQLMLTSSVAPQNDRAVKRALLEGAITEDGFKKWFDGTAFGLGPVLKQATRYPGAESGLELELVVGHAQQGVFHLHCYCRDCDLKTHRRLGLVGYAGRVVLNGLGLAMIGTRRQKALGLKPIPQLQRGQLKETAQARRKEKNKELVEVITGWGLLEMAMKMRRGDPKAHAEALRVWRAEGSIPKKDPRRRARDRALGTPYDEVLSDYIDKRYDVLRATFPASERFFLEEIEAEKAKNEKDVAKATVSVVRELLDLGKSHEWISERGLDPLADPREAARVKAENARKEAELTATREREARKQAERDKALAEQRALAAEQAKEEKAAADKASFERLVRKRADQGLWDSSWDAASEALERIANGVEKAGDLDFLHPKFLAKAELVLKFEPENAPAIEPFYSARRVCLYAREDLHDPALEYTLSGGSSLTVG